LIQVVEVVRKAVENGRKIVVTGAGASALLGLEFAGQGYETGLPVYCYTNNLADANPVAFAKGLGESEGELSRYIEGLINARARERVTINFNGKDLCPKCYQEI